MSPRISRRPKGDRPLRRMHRMREPDGVRTRLWEMDIYTLRAIASLDKFEIANSWHGRRIIRRPQSVRDAGIIRPACR